MRIPKGEKEKEAEDIFEKIIDAIFRGFQEVQEILIRKNTNISTPRYIIFKRQKIKEKEKLLEKARVGNNTSPMEE